MNRQLQILVVVVTLICSIKFFDTKFIDPSLLNYIQYLSVGIVVLVSFPYLLPKVRGFVLPLQLFLLAIVISIVMSYAHWDQGWKEGILVTFPYFILMLFFFLLKVAFPLRILEKIIVAYGVLYIVLFIFQFLNAPTIFFGHSLWGDEFIEDRGVIRIIFPGGGIFILCTFLALNKLTSQKKHLWFWGVLTLFGIIVPVMQVTRQFILGISLIYLFHFMRTLSLPRKLTLIGLGLLTLFILLNSSLPVIEGLIESTQEDTDVGKDYIRVLAGEFFLTDFSPNTITAIFGNGVPSWGVSDYGIYVESLGEERYYFLSDVGIIAIYSMFGMLAILAYVLIWGKSFFLRLPAEFSYLKYYLWFLLLTSFTWYSTYSYHYLTTTVFVLYMYQVSYRTNNEKIPQESLE